MKKLVLRLTLICFLAFGAGSLSSVFAQYDYETEAAPDTLSIDDMDPVLFSEDEATEEKKCCPGLYIGIAVVAVAAGVLVYRTVSKKKQLP